MKKTYYYIVITFIVTLLFSFKVNAQPATSTLSVTIPVTNGTNIEVQTISYTNLAGTIVDAEDIQSTSQSWFEYNPEFVIWMRGTNQQWINGYSSIDFYYPTPSMIYMNSVDIETTNVDGLQVFVSQFGSYLRIRVFFDNYYNQANQVTLAKIQVHYIDTETAYSATSSATFIPRIVNQDSNIEKTSVVTNNRTTALLYSAITQATGEQLSDIISMLTAIKNQDLTYYVNIVNQLAQLHTDNQQLHIDLTGILNEVDLDFQAVQTVLDLFPSYRTQVLQYWQQLLEMNAQQSQAAAEQASVADDKNSQSQQLINGMGSLSMPSLAANDLDILSGIDATQKTNFFGLIGLITHTEIITKIMLIIVMGAIVGFILYGKKS